MTTRSGRISEIVSSIMGERSKWEADFDDPEPGVFTLRCHRFGTPETFEYATKEGALRGAAHMIDDNEAIPLQLVTPDGEKIDYPDILDKIEALP